MKIISILAVPVLIVLFSCVSNPSKDIIKYSEEPEKNIKTDQDIEKSKILAAESLELYNVKSFTDSIDKALQALSINNENGEAYLVLAQSYEQMDQKENAIDSYIKASKYIQNTAPIYSKISWLYGPGMNNWDSAIKYIELSLSIDPKESMANRLYGDYYLGKMDLSKALNAYIISGWQDPWTLERMSDCYQKTGDIENAKTYIIKAKETWEKDHSPSDDPNYYKILTEKYDLLTREKINNSSNIENINKSNLLTYESTRLFIEKSYLSSVNRALEAISLNTENGDAYLILAQAYEQMDQKEKAIDSYLNAIKYCSNTAPIYSKISWLYGPGMNNWDSAIKYIELSLSIDPKESMANRLFGDYNLGKLNFAIALKAYIISGWQDPWTLERMSDCYQKTGDIENAKTYITRAKESWEKDHSSSDDPIYHKVLTDKYKLLLRN